MSLLLYPEILSGFMTGDGPTLTAAAAASCLPASAKFSIPGGYWYVGRMWRLRAYGRISNVITIPGTARFDLRFGATVIFDSLAMPLNAVAKANVPWSLDVLLTCRSPGSGTAATLLGQGTWESEAVLASPAPTAGGSGQFLIPFNTAPVAGGGFDSTSSQTIDMFFTQTVATGSMTVHQFFVEALN